MSAALVFAPEEAPAQAHQAMTPVEIKEHTLALALVAASLDRPLHSLPCRQRP